MPQLVATRVRSTGVEVSVIDDEGIEHILWKKDHDPEVPVPSEWYIPIVEARVAARIQLAMQEEALLDEFANKVQIQSERHNFIDLVAASITTNSRLDAALRALARAAREEGVI